MPSPCGAFSSRTRIVMLTAMTPSLNASSRFFSTPPLPPAAPIVLRRSGAAEGAVARRHVRGRRLGVERELGRFVVRSPHGVEQPLERREVAVARRCGGERFFDALVARDDPRAGAAHARCALACAAAVARGALAPAREPVLER